MLNCFVTRLAASFSIALFFACGVHAQGVQLVDARHNAECTECLTLMLSEKYTSPLPDKERLEKFVRNEMKKL